MRQPNWGLFVWEDRFILTTKGWIVFLSVAVVLGIFLSKDNSVIQGLFSKETIPYIEPHDYNVPPSTRGGATTVSKEKYTEKKENATDTTQVSKEFSHPKGEAALKNAEKWNRKMEIDSI